MSLKDDLKNIVINEEVSGPFISLFLPLYPSKDSFKLDDSEFDSLLAKAKKEYIDQFGKKGWEKYEEKIRDIKNDIIFDYAQSKSLGVIVGKEATYHYYLPRKVQLQVRVSEQPYILPIIRGYEFMPTYNILKVSQDSFKMFEFKNGLVTAKALPADAPTSAATALNIDVDDQKIRMEEKEGNTSYDQYRGYDVEAEAKQSEMDHYFRIVDEYVIKHVSLRDHLPVVLMVNKADFGEFTKISHNQYLDKEDMMTVPSITNHESLGKVLDPINKKFIDKCRQNVEAEIDTGRSKHRCLAGMEKVQQAATEGRLDMLFLAHELVQNETETAEQINANNTAILTLVYGGQVNIVDASLLNGDEIIGILRGI